MKTFKIELTVTENNGFYLKELAGSAELDGEKVEYLTRVPSRSPVVFIDGRYFQISSNDIVNAVAYMVVGDGAKGDEHE